MSELVKVATADAPYPDTLLLDADGSEEVVHSLIESGKLAYVRIKSFDDLEDYFFKEIVAKKRHFKMVIIDSISALSLKTRLHLTTDTSKRSNSTLVKENGLVRLWPNREAITTDQREYGQMAELISRLIIYFENVADTVVIIGHEAEEYKSEDAPAGSTQRIRTATGRNIPNLTPALWKFAEPLVGVLGRYGKALSRFEYNGVKYTAGTRILRLQESSEYVAKCRVRDTLPQAPELVVNPTMNDLIKICGGLPERVMLYGAPGSGKTTFAVSHLREQSKSQATPTAIAK